MAAAFVSFTSGSASRSVTVPSGTDRLLVVCTIGSTAFTAERTVTYGGVTCSVATSSNDYVQIHYLLSPTVGSATLSVSGTAISTVIAAHYTGIGSFQTASEASAASITLSPSGAAVMVVGISASSSSHTPLTSTNERHDTAGEWYGDRIVTGSGSITVGVSSATDPDAAGAVFLEPSTAVSASGTPSALLPTATGTATVTVDASGTANALLPTVSGSATVVVDASGSVAALIPTASGSATVVVDVSGSVAAPVPTASGSATVVVDVSGSVAAPIPTATGSAEVIADDSVSGNAAAPIPTATGSADVELVASGDVAAPVPTATGTVDLDLSVSGSVGAPVPTASGTVEVVVEVSGAVFAPLPTAFGTNLGAGRFTARAAINEAHSSATVVDPLARGRIGRPRTTVTED